MLVVRVGSPKGGVPRAVMERGQIWFSIEQVEGNNGTRTQPHIPPQEVRFEIQKVHALKLIQILSEQLFHIEDDLNQRLDNLDPWT